MAHFIEIVAPCTMEYKDILCKNKVVENKFLQWPV